jgi:hypothetical protein
LVALVAPVAGCGGDGGDEEAYEREVRKAGQTLEQTFGELGTSISGSGNTERAAQTLDEGATSLDRASSELGDVDPPSDVEAHHDELVAGLAELAADFREAADVAREGELAPLLEFASTLPGRDSVEKVTRAGTAIEAEGYEVTPGE